MRRRECPVVFQTRGPGHHFFGYYDKSPLDRSERRLLSHRARFDFKRLPKAGDVVTIGYWNLDDGAYHELAETRAYNWQQGAQLQWLPPDYEARVIFNDREEDRFVSRIVDVRDGSVQTLPLPIYTINPNGKSAICINYERIYFPRPGYRYEGIVKPHWDQPLPRGDGLWRLDLVTGEHRQIIRTEDMVEFHPSTSMQGGSHYLEHAMFNLDGTRFCFFHCWTLPDGAIYSRLVSADEWGDELRRLLDTGMISHTGWRSAEELCAWGRPPSTVASLRKSRWITRFVVKPLLPLYHAVSGRLARGQLVGDTYLLFNDRTGGVEKLAPDIRFPDNGHCTWRPRDPRWMLTDSYEDHEFHRHLYLYDHNERQLIEIGSFYSIPETCNTGFRCDLHPRWGHSGRLVCIDSTHEDGERQMYVLDVTPVVDEPRR